MTDPFVEAVDRVKAASRSVDGAIQLAVAELVRGQQERLAGRSMSEVVDLLIGMGGRETRLAAADAFRDYERAVAAMRAVVVRLLVDEDGLSFTEVAKHMRISRQAVARLYQP